MTDAGKPLHPQPVSAMGRETRSGDRATKGQPRGEGSANATVGGRRFAADERPARAHVEARDATASWIRRAEWLESEASSRRDPKTRARLLIAASEIRALLGDAREARRLVGLAESCSDSAASLVARQARAMAREQGDPLAAVERLRREAQAAKHPAVRTQAHYLAAELSRLMQRDDRRSQAELDLAEQSDAADCRASLQQLATRLAKSFGPPEVAFGTAETLQPLRDAVAQLRRLRGDRTTRLDSHDCWALALRDSANALAEQRLDRAAEALAPLGAAPGLRGCVAWLQALWASARGDDDDARLEAIRRLLATSPGRLARRTLATRGLAARDDGAVREALARPAETSDGGETSLRADAFSRVERISLQALIGDSVPQAELEEARGDAALSPLLAALDRLASTPPDESRREERSISERHFHLGRVAARGGVTAIDPQSLDLPERDVWRRASELERARQEGDSSGVAASLPSLLPESSSLSSECHYLSGIILERAGHSSRARDHYQRSMVSAVTREPATRALATTPAESARLLRSLSTYAETPSERAQLLTEALYRLPPEAAELDALAEDACIATELPFAAFAAEIAARMRGDRSRVERWLERQQQCAESPDEALLQALRRALFVAESDPATANAILAEASTRQPNDLALQDLRESLDDLPARARARFRRQAAPRVGQRLRTALLHEAVLLYQTVGDHEAAASTAREMQAPPGVQVAARFSRDPADLEERARHLKRAAEATESIEERCLHLAELAELELQQGRPDAAAACHRRIVELDPDSLRSLRVLEKHAQTQTKMTELIGISSELAARLPEQDGLPYAFIGSRLLIDSGRFAESAALARRAADVQPAPLWALRLQAAHARSAGDDEALVSLYEELIDRATQPLDVATLSLRVAESAVRLRQAARARQAIDRAAEIAPDNVLVLAARAEILRAAGDHAEAAEAFEGLAADCESPERRSEALYRAACIWLDVLGDRGRGVLALQEAASTSAAHAPTLERLRQIHVETGNYEELQALAERQRGQTTDPSRTASLDVTRALALSRTGKREEAQRLLRSVLDEQPENVEALDASARLHFDERDWQAAEQEFRASIDACQGDESRKERLSAWSALAEIYEKHLPDSARAKGAYLALLESDPQDTTARRRLIRLLLEREERSEALREHRELFERAPSDEDRRQYLLEMVELLGTTGDELKDAEGLLEQARSTWPDNAQVVKAEVDYYRRAGDETAARVIVERATNAARNAVQAGRVEPGLFRTLEVTARLGGDPDMARAAQIALAAIRGGDSSLSGAGAAAGERRFDDLVAPAPLSAGFRKLLYGFGGAIDRAYSIDEDALELQPLEPARAHQVSTVAASFGLNEVEVMVSPALGSDCTPLPGERLRIVFGQDLLDHESPRVRDFLLLRALKIAQVNACALSRMSTTDLWSAVAGFLACFGEPPEATGADARRLLTARNAIQPFVTQRPDPELEALLPAMATNVLPQAAQIADAITRWSCRVALLGVGDLGVALSSLWASEDLGDRLPTDWEARVRWIAGSAQARDLVSYGVSEAYTEARRRAALSTAPR